jgi:hypothetical protein
MELLLPGFVIGLSAGSIAGGLAVLGHLPAGYVAGTAVGLGLSLALAGAGYNALLAAGRLRMGGVAPAAAYWIVCFPAARAVHEFVLDLSLGRPLGLPDTTPAFFGFQALVGVGFAIGFVWLHERIAPLWWMRIRNRNPRAQQYMDVYVRQAVMSEQRRKATKAGRTKPGRT